MEEAKKKRTYDQTFRTYYVVEGGGGKAEEKATAGHPIACNSVSWAEKCTLGNFMLWQMCMSFLWLFSSRVTSLYFSFWTTDERRSAKGRRREQEDASQERGKKNLCLKSICFPASGVTRDETVLRGHGSVYTTVWTLRFGTTEKKKEINNKNLHAYS